MSFLESLSAPGLSATGLSTTGSNQPDTPRCSRKACRAAAQWQLLWNNPAVHTPERRKIWLACAEHRQWLEDYLQVRGFLRDTQPFPESGTPVTEGGTPSENGTPVSEGEAAEKSSGV